MALNERITHYVGTGDTRTPFGATLKQGGSAVNLTGLTVEAKVIDASDDSVTTDWTTTGVTVVTAASGEVQYDFASADVATSGVRYLWFRVLDGAEYDTFPSDGRKIKIQVSDSA